MTSVMSFRSSAALFVCVGLGLACLALIPAGCRNDVSSPISETDPSALDRGGLFGQEAPADCWVRYVAFERPGHPTWGLMIRRDGMAIASRSGEGPGGRIILSNEALRSVRTWFEEAGFRELEDEYVSDRPQRGRMFEVFLREGDRSKRVRADADAMPRQLRLLVERLQNMTERVWANRPDRDDPPGIRGELTIDPETAPPGTERFIRLSLVNPTDDTLRLVFPSTQLYDFLLAHPPSGPGPGGGDHGHHGSEVPPRDPIWNWAYGQVFPDAMTEIVLGPGEVVTYEEAWDGLANEGPVVGPGMYALVARIPSDVPVPVLPVRLHVQGDDPDERPLEGMLVCRPAEGPPETARTMTLSITNLAHDSVSVHFRTEQRHDFVLSHERGMGPGPDGGSDGACDPPPNGPRPVWRWSEGRAFEPVEGVETWAPGETRTYTVEWDGLADGDPVGPGSYLLHGFLTGVPRIASRPVTVVVTRR